MSQIVGLDPYQVGYGEGFQDESIVGADDGRGGALNAKQLPQSFAGSIPFSLAISGASQLVAIKVLRNIRPDRVVIDRVQAAGVLIADIKIGTVSLNASNGQMPGDAFAPDAVGTSMRSAMTANPSLDINFFVVNKTAGALALFAIGVIGPSSPG